jgi:hypothetical protein
MARWTRWRTACALGGSLLGTSLAVWLLPHGFPSDHPRFWAHDVLPACIALASVVGLVTLQRALSSHVAGAIGAFLLAFGVSLILLYGGEGAFVALLPLLCGLLLVLWARIDGSRLQGLWGVPAGLLLALALRSPPATTSPLGTAAHEVDRASPQIVKLSGVTVMIDPRLRFSDRSLHRFWTLGGPKPATPKHHLELTRTGNDVVHIDASSTLTEDVYAHLATQTELGMVGAEHLALWFSPCEHPIDVEIMDYPIGRPARIATLSPDGVFRVVEARSAEKGPFHLLCEGPLHAGDALSITIVADGSPVGTVRLHDWTSQASTALSPTAGWGLPQNAIEFRRDEEGMASIFVTLAATSVGRGFDSVGHKAGTYRNRISVEPAR